MTLKDRFESVFDGDERAVSPVIGVILMVAITVILAAVIATFVIDLGGSQDNAPQASFQFSEGDNGVTITHGGGDTIPADQLTINIDGTAVAEGDDFSGQVSAGTSTTVNPGENSNTITIVWNSPSSDQTAILGEYTI